MTKTVATPSLASWRDIPLHPLQDAAKICGVSIGSLYRFASEGRLTLKRLAGRTLVSTDSLALLIDSAEAWVPSTRAAKARSVRAERALAKEPRNGRV